MQHFGLTECIQEAQHLQHFGLNEYIQVAQYCQVSGIVLMKILAAYLDRAPGGTYREKINLLLQYDFSFQAEFRDDPYV